jgi:hypothetical protein
METKTNLFLGSSIISEWDTSHFFPNQQNVNLGISGMKTSDLINKYSVLFTDKYTPLNSSTKLPVTISNHAPMERPILNLHGYKNMKFQNIILYIGSNDVTQDKNEADIIKNIIDFIVMLRVNFKKSKIILIALFKSPDRTADQLKKIDYINKKLRDYAMISKNLFVYNFNRQLVSKNNFMEDKIHLSEIGYQKLTRCMKMIFSL